MYAIIETGSKQYRVNKGDILEVEKLDKKAGETIKLDKVLFFDDGKNALIGTPYLKNVTVNCEILSEVKDKKVVSFKYRRRESYKRKVGHRQRLTRMEVKDIKVA